MSRNLIYRTFINNGEGRKTLLIFLRYYEKNFNFTIVNFRNWTIL